ncbi:MAG: prepilin-type N-terminal cleavage/methylation domain-containing protein [Alphaproteobacteria bacterium]
MTAHSIQKGFSIAEVVMVVAVLAVLVGMIISPIQTFITKQKKQQEENQITEITKAIEVFADRYGALPDDNAANNGFCDADLDASGQSTWYECLSAVSSLSGDQIRFDTWGNERRYVHYQSTGEILFGTAVPMHYATIFGRGANMTAEAGTDIPTQVITGDVFREFKVATDTAWWANQASPETNFRNLNAVGDDDLIKYTDRGLKTEKYNETLNRLNKISEALATYANTKYLQAIIAVEANAAKKVFYPPARDTGSGATADSIANYGTGAVSDGATYAFSVSNRVENRGGTLALEQSRYDDMVKLMRLLGLPDSYCCNAMLRNTFDNDLERAFFYYSNPLVKVGGSCASSRAKVSDSAPRYLPARLTIAADTCG